MPIGIDMDRLNLLTLDYLQQYIILAILTKIKKINLLSCKLCKFQIIIKTQFEPSKIDLMINFQLLQIICGKRGHNKFDLNQL